MNKHTPGPWVFNKDKDHGTWTIRAGGESLMVDDQYYTWVPSEEADWHLIAAAPELLEALKVANEALCDLPLMDQRIVLIRAAIQSAEGTKP